MASIPANINVAGFPESYKAASTAGEDTSKKASEQPEGQHPDEDILNDKGISCSIKNSESRADKSTPSTEKAQCDGCPDCGDGQSDEPSRSDKRKGPPLPYPDPTERRKQELDYDAPVMPKSSEKMKAAFEEAKTAATAATTETHTAKAEEEEEDKMYGVIWDKDTEDPAKPRDGPHHHKGSHLHQQKPQSRKSMSASSSAGKAQSDGPADSGAGEDKNKDKKLWQNKNCDICGKPLRGHSLPFPLEQQPCGDKPVQRKEEDACDGTCPTPSTSTSAAGAGKAAATSADDKTDCVTCDGAASDGEGSASGASCGGRKDSSDKDADGSKSAWKKAWGKLTESHEQKKKQAHEIVDVRDPRCGPASGGSSPSACFAAGSASEKEKKGGKALADEASPIPKRA